MNGRLRQSVTTNVSGIFSERLQENISKFKTNGKAQTSTRTELVNSSHLLKKTASKLGNAGYKRQEIPEILVESHQHSNILIANVNQTSNDFYDSLLFNRSIIKSNIKMNEKSLNLQANNLSHSSLYDQKSTILEKSKHSPNKVLLKPIQEDSLSKTSKINTKLFKFLNKSSKKKEVLTNNCEIANSANNANNASNISANVIVKQNEIASPALLSKRVSLKPINPSNAAETAERKSVCFENNKIVQIDETFSDSTKLGSIESMYVTKNAGNNLLNRNIENPEELHFVLVSIFKKHKQLAYKFDKVEKVEKSETKTVENLEEEEINF